MTKSTKPKKGDIPVLTNPRLNTSEYTNPMDIVLEVKDGQPFTIKNLVDDHKLLKERFNQLIELLKNKEV